MENLTLNAILEEWLKTGKVELAKPMTRTEVLIADVLNHITRKGGKKNAD